MKAFRERSMYIGKMNVGKATEEVGRERNRQ